MRAQNCTAIESLLNRGIRRTLHSERERPLGGFKILRLYSAEPPHNVNRFSKLRLRQSLVSKPLPNEIRFHYVTFVPFCG